MKILFDATHIAQSIVHPEFQTGIFRYGVEFLKTVNSNGFKSTIICGLSGEDSFECDFLAQRLRESLPHLNNQIATFPKNLFGFNYRSLIRTLFSRKEKPTPFSGLLRKLAVGLRSVAGSLKQRFLTGTDFDVIHRPSPHLIPCESMAGVPRVVTIHDVLPVKHPFLFRKDLVIRFTEAFQSIQFDRELILCDSQATRDDVLSIFPASPERCWIVPLAAADHFYPMKDPALVGAVLTKWGIEADQYLLSVATLEPRKNLPLLVRCYKEMVQAGEIKNCPLVLVGGPGWGGVQEQIKRLIEGYEMNFVITGRVADDELRALYNGARAFIYIPCSEGFGLPPLEAMQCGTPVVVSKARSLTEVVGDAGVQVDLENELTLRQAILKVLTNDDLRLDLRAKGLDRARGFSWKQTAELTFEAYRYAFENCQV